MAKAKRDAMAEELRVFENSPRVIAVIDLEGEITVPEKAASLLLPSANVRLIVCNPTDIMSVLEAIQVCDFCLFLARRETRVAADCMLLKCIRAQGIPSVDLGIVLDSTEELAKGEIDALKKNWQPFFDFHFSTNQKPFVLPLESAQFHRHISTIKPRNLNWREKRPYLVVESIENRPDGVVVRGWNRGKPFLPSDLVHMPDGTSAKISALMDAAGNVISTITTTTSSEMQQDLDEMAVEDNDIPMDESNSDAEMGTQTEEQAGKDALEIKKRVPKGTSDYQAAWYDSGDEYSDYEEITVEKEEPEFEFEAYKEFQRGNEEGENPDEKLLDADVLARKRFVKYRGLQNFRQCKWDLTQDLPPFYKNIHSVQNMAHFAKLDAKTRAQSRIRVGDYISLFIEARSLSNVNAVFGLLKNEELLSVLNFVVQKDTELPVKSKEGLVAMIGFRKIQVQPTWSDNYPGTVHKYERLFEGIMVGSVYGPVCTVPCPVLLFRQTDKLEFVGQGSVLDNNPNRLVLKRITLTGSPFKINRKSAVVRFMFFNPADILYFKPVQLSTRKGTKGHIKESLGTKGYMKCIFEKMISQQDVICLHLYKRQFPKAIISPEQ